MTYCKRSGLLISPFTNLKLGFLAPRPSWMSFIIIPSHPKQEKKPSVGMQLICPDEKGSLIKHDQLKRFHLFYRWDWNTMRDLDAQLPYHWLKVLGVRTIVQAIQNHNPQIKCIWECLIALLQNGPGAFSNEVDTHVPWRWHCILACDKGSLKPCIAVRMREIPTNILPFKCGACLNSESLSSILYFGYLKNKCSATWLAIKPAPPVMRMFLGS